MEHFREKRLKNNKGQMVISEKNKILITRVIDTINWPLIHKFYKLVGRTIGTETIQISGIKKLDKKTAHVMKELKEAGIK